MAEIIVKKFFPNLLTNLSKSKEWITSAFADISRRNTEQDNGNEDIEMQEVVPRNAVAVNNLIVPQEGMTMYEKLKKLVKGIVFFGGGLFLITFLFAIIGYNEMLKFIIRIGELFVPAWTYITLTRQLSGDYLISCVSFKCNFQMK